MSNNKLDKRIVEFLVGKGDPHYKWCEFWVKWNNFDAYILNHPTIAESMPRYLLINEEIVRYATKDEDTLITRYAREKRRENKND